MLLGHKDVTTTLRVYNSVDQSQFRNATDKLDGLFETPVKTTESYWDDYDTSRMIDYTDYREDYRDDDGYYLPDYSEKSGGMEM